MLIDGAP